MRFRIDKMSVKTLIEKFSNNIITIKNVYEITDKDSVEVLDDLPESDYGYQRSSVWNDKMKNGLLLSMLKGYPIPSILLWKNSESIKYPNGDIEDVYEVIDGQQRLLTINGFKKGSHVIKSTMVDFNEFFNKDAEKNFSNLIDDKNKEFNAFEISTLILEGVDKEEAIQVFKDLNSNSKSLTSHEIREADNSGNGNNSMIIKFIETNDFLIKTSNIEKKEIPNTSTAREYIFRLYLFLRSDRTKFIGYSKKNLDSQYSNRMGDFDLNEKELIEFLEKISIAFEKTEIFKSKMYLPLYLRIFIDNKEDFLKNMENINTFFTIKDKDDKEVNADKKESFKLKSSIQPNDSESSYKIFKEYILK